MIWINKNESHLSVRLITTIFFPMIYFSRDKNISVHYILLEINIPSI